MPSSVSARRRFAENLSKLPHPLVQPTDTSMQVPDPQIPKLARPVSPAEREDSIQQRQRPAEVNTVLTIARAYSGNEIATLMDDQKALHTAKVNELLNMDKIWCGGGGRKTAIATGSFDKLGIKTETGRIIQT